MAAGLKQRLFAAFIGFGLLLALPIDASAQGTGAVVPLNAAATYLPGVVGEAVPAFPIDSGLAQLAAGTRSQRLRPVEPEGHRTQRLA